MRGFYKKHVYLGDLPKELINPIILHFFYLGQNSFFNFMYLIYFQKQLKNCLNILVI